MLRCSRCLLGILYPMEGKRENEGCVRVLGGVEWRARLDSHHEDIEHAEECAALRRGREPSDERIRHRHGESPRNSQSGNKENGRDDLASAEQRTSPEGGC